MTANTPQYAGNAQHSRLRLCSLNCHRTSSIHLLYLCCSIALTWQAEHLCDVSKLLTQLVIPSSNLCTGIFDSQDQVLARHLQSPTADHTLQSLSVKLVLRADTLPWHWGMWHGSPDTWWGTGVETAWFSAAKERGWHLLRGAVGVC